MTNSTKTFKTNEPFVTADESGLTDAVTYTVAGKKFITQPVFKSEACETVGTILLKLLLKDGENT